MPQTYSNEEEGHVCIKVTLKVEFSLRFVQLNVSGKPRPFKNRPGCLFIRTFFTEEFLYPLTYVKMFETVCMKLYLRSRHA